MKKTFFILTAIAIFYSCKKDGSAPAIVLPLEDNSLPSAALAGVQVINETADYLEYALDMAVFRDSKNIENQLKAENFLNDTLISGSISYYFTLKDLDFINGSSETPYSAVMLMDQSGSIITSDPSDFRLDAASVFCRNLGAGDDVSLWSFQGSGYTQLTPFIRDTSVLLPAINDLDGKEGSGTPLYYSQYNTTGFCATNATNANRAVMTFTDGVNTTSSTTSQQVIDNALAKNIKLYNIGLGEAETAELTRQALATNGAFMFAEDARQLISVFGNLGKMLNKSATYYHTVWRVSKSSGTFTSGTLSFYVTIALPYGGTVTVPFAIEY